MSTYLQSALKKKKEKLINASEARRPTAQVSLDSFFLSGRRLSIPMSRVRITLLMRIPLVCFMD
jgi:hypothetical protein